MRIVEYDEAHGTCLRSISRSDETIATLLEKSQNTVGDLWYSGVIGGLPVATDK